MKLEHPTRTGRTIITEKIIGRKDLIVGMVNDFITERIHKPAGWIKIVRFSVEIEDSKGNVKYHWGYTPTYR